LTIHAKRCHNSAASEARALGDIMSESMGGIISECPGDFIGIGRLKHLTRTLIAPAHPNKKTAGNRRSFRLQLGLMRSTLL
jgi:hypothetical protein